MPLEKAQPADITQQYPSCLVAACSGAQIGIAGALLGAGANANLADENNHTPLCAAAQTGCVDLIALLLDAKADMNALSAKGQTALMAAAAAGHLKVVQLLLESQADVHCHNSSGETALTECLGRGIDVQVVTALLSAGAKLPGVDFDGFDTYGCLSQQETVLLKEHCCDSESVLETSIRLCQARV